MNKVIDEFVESMIPILERESGMFWGEKSVGRIVYWTLNASNTTIAKRAKCKSCEKEVLVFHTGPVFCSNDCANDYGPTPEDVGY